MLKFKTIALAAACLACLPMMAQEEPQSEEQKLEEWIAKEVERLEDNLKLEDWQVFFVDSTLSYNYRKLSEEIKALQRSGAANQDLYYNVQDKWMVATEESYKKHFSEAQWNTYLKQGGAKIIKEREKRQKKTIEATNGKKK